LHNAGRLLETVDGWLIENETDAEILTKEVVSGESIVAKQA